MPDEFDWEATQGDYGKEIAGVLKNALGEPVNLSLSTSIVFRLGTPYTSPVIEGDAVFDPDQSANTGLVRYTTEPGDLDAAGDKYEAVWIVTWADAVPPVQLTFPTNPLRVLIKPKQLAPAP